MTRSSSIDSYRDLEVWQRGIDLVEQTDEVTERFPAEEKYGLTAQLRRAVVSISSNIAEGWGYSSRKQYVHFLEQARRSLLEVEPQLIIAERLECIPRSTLKDRLARRLSRAKCCSP